jgi:predicted pyridoxine 5'-phosphate oxidase superfamily flavin-nucleotide-binding protein
MPKYPSDIGFSPAVKAIQVEKGSRDSYAKLEQRGGWKTGITPELESFISKLDMFYLGTSSAEGQPYIQYRGGPQGFLRVIDSKTLGFADFAGNQQYISLGNLSENPKAFIFLMDYANSRRIKLWGNARVVEDDAHLLESLQSPKYEARVERAILFEIGAWDVNCPQHIHKRFSQQQVAPVIEELRTNIEQLEEKLRSAEQENASLRAKSRDAG